MAEEGLDSPYAYVAQNPEYYVVAHNGNVAEASALLAKTDDDEDVAMGGTQARARVRAARAKARNLAFARLRIY